MKKLNLFFLSTVLSVFSFAQNKATLTVNFDFNKYDLTPGARVKLDSFITKVSPFQIPYMQLRGYCDGKGSDAYNADLSLKRITAVTQYLENKNIRPDAVSAKGFGKNGLLNNDLTEEESYQNRRVEIIATLKEGPVEQVKKEIKTLTAILQDSTIKKGDLITLQNLEFENSSDILLNKSLPVLDELYNVLVKNPALNIAIEGHICCVAQLKGQTPENTPSFNVAIRRARKVWTYLIQKGIDGNRLSYQGFGNTRPIYPIPERSAEEMSANRRVEIRIISK